MTEQVLQDVPLVLDEDSQGELAVAFERRQRAISDQFQDERDFRGYGHPPKRPDLTWTEAAEISKSQLASLRAQWKAAKEPKSRVRVPGSAWAMNLRPLANNLDIMARDLLNTYDFFLCRHILSLVEDTEEKIEWAVFEIHHPRITVYQLWPKETFRVRSQIDAQAGLSAEVGIGMNLDLVDASVKGGASVIWRATWQWVSAVVKAWGLGDSSAGWRLERDPRSPFAGDRELYLMVQTPKRFELKEASVSVRARINPRGWERAWTYESQPNEPIRIRYG